MYASLMRTKLPQQPPLPSTRPTFSVIEYNYCCSGLEPVIRYSGLRLSIAESFAGQLNLEEEHPAKFYRVVKDYFCNQ